MKWGSSAATDHLKQPAVGTTVSTLHPLQTHLSTHRDTGWGERARVRYGIAAEIMLAEGLSSSYRLTTKSIVSQLEKLRMRTMLFLF
jgi:hypothetical protein